MFVLTNAVSNTSLNLPVRERIAEGLGQSGVSIFVNLGVELLSLCILYVGIPTRVIREMVVFGAIALVVDYAMEMTYFLTVLSIDMQRLELADFLSQGLRTESEPVNGHEKQSSSGRGKSGSIASFAEGFFRSIRERRARTYTAIFVSAFDMRGLSLRVLGPEIGISHALPPVSSSDPITSSTFSSVPNTSSRPSARISTLPKGRKSIARPAPPNRRARPSGTCWAHGRQSLCTSTFPRQLCCYSTRPWHSRA